MRLSMVSSLMKHILMISSARIGVKAMVEKASNTLTQLCRRSHANMSAGWGFAKSRDTVDATAKGPHDILCPL